jgi:SAM-dependent methyltransferase
MDTRQHWDSVYGTKAAEQVSWFRPHLDRSLEFISALKLPHDAEFIDVGGGASTLVDDLLARGYSRLTVIDLSSAALALSRKRLGDLADRVRWLAADVTRDSLPGQPFHFWHDRAVFHFLLEPAVRARYVAVLARSLTPGGHALISTFGPNGPKKCSGLDVNRYSAAELDTELGSDLERVADSTELHTTPSGAEQEFVYGLFRRRANC